MVDTAWRVLIVEDSGITSRVIDAILRQCGFVEIETVDDGHSALNKLRERKYDLVLCDWEMPGMDGVSVLRQVRQDPASRDTRFILVSAKKDARWVQLARDAEADSLISKPFDAATLKRKILDLPIRGSPQ